MASDERMIDNLCRRIEADLGNGTTDAMLNRFEAIIQTQTARGTNAVVNWRCRLLFIAAVIAVIFIPLMLTVRNHLIEKDVPFWFEAKGRTLGKPGERFAAGPKESAAISFQNGSTLTLEENTEVIVAKSSDREVRFEMDRGNLFLDVEGKESGQWIVDLGQYRVSVLGTKFWVSWHEQVRILDVKVVKGAVLVEGAKLGDRGIVVAQGNHFRADGAMGFFAMNVVGSSFYDPSSPSLLIDERVVKSEWDERYDAMSAAVGSAQNDIASNHVKQVTSGAIDNESMQGPTIPDADTTQSRKKSGIQNGNPDRVRGSSKQEKTHRSAPSQKPSQTMQTQEQDKLQWQVFLERGEYTAVIMSAEQQGYKKILETVDADNLWLLMNTARRMERHRLAEEMLLTVRKRFPNTTKASLASFVLGKVNYYGKKDADSAAKWFQTYLDENPEGPLVEEAMGRLIMLLNELGKKSEALKIAKQYIEKYPNGRFSSSIRSLLPR